MAIKGNSNICPVCETDPCICETGQHIHEVDSGTAVRDMKQQATSQAERAKLTLQSAMLKIKQAKEREAIAKKKKSIKESFSQSQIDRLKSEYSKINKIDPSGDAYKKLIAMLDKLDKASLEKLAGADIKFVSGLAKNRVNRMKLKEALSPKQKKLDVNKNGKIDGDDLSKLRKETLSPKQKALDKNKNGKIDGDDLAKLRNEEGGNKQMKGKSTCNIQRLTCCNITGNLVVSHLGEMHSSGDNIADFNTFVGIDKTMSSMQNSRFPTQ